MEVFVEEALEGGEVGFFGVGVLEGDGELGVGGEAEELLVGLEVQGGDAEGAIGEEEFGLAVGGEGGTEIESVA